METEEFVEGDVVCLKNSPDFRGKITLVYGSTQPKQYWVEGPNINYCYFQDELELCSEN